MSNDDSSLPYAKVSVAPQETGNDEQEEKLSIATLRSRFEHLAAPQVGVGAGTVGTKKPTATGGPIPYGHSNAAAAAGKSPTISANQSTVLTPASEPECSGTQHAQSNARPRPPVPGKPILISTPASPEPTPASPSIQDFMFPFDCSSDPSGIAGLLSSSPKLASSPVLLSPKPSRRPPPIVPSKIALSSTPSGSDDGDDPGLQPQPASVRALRESFGASSAAAESSTTARRSVSLTQSQSEDDSQRRLEPVAMVRQASAPLIKQVTASSTEPRSESPQPITERSTFPNVGDEQTMGKKPPPPPPPLFRSASPAPVQTLLAGKPPRIRASSSPVSPLPSPALPEEATERVSTAAALPSLPKRKLTLSNSVSGSSPSSPRESHPYPTGSVPATIPGEAKGKQVAAPPPLPERPRGQSVGQADDTRGVPRLPVRTAMTANSLPVHTLASSPLHSSRLPSSPQDHREANNGYQPLPPPMRSAMAGCISSPPPRVEDSPRAEASSDEDDDEDAGTGPGLPPATKRIFDDFPDSTHANRRPPAFVPDVRINSMHHVNSYAVFGRYVCTGAHHVRVHDTQMSDRPILVVDLKDVGLDFRIKDPKVTAMCFRPVVDPADEGRYLWCGTKDGHLWELDIKSGAVTETRSFVHSSPVVHIFRHKHWLLTLEETGRLHVFEIGYTAENGITGTASTPQLTRTVRITEKFTFAKMIYGRLWTATAPANRSTTNSAARGATIRVYDPCSLGTMQPGQAIPTTEWTGAVTSATMLPLRPDLVYLGHEGGFVSVWSTLDLGCVQVLKISSTDILALEGVGERLWAGNRKGQIHVYDITERPWRTTNTWTAHPDLPVQTLILDPWSIEHAGRFHLWSVARDTIRSWDGLLSVDWIDTQMTIRQPEYCTFRDIKVLVCSWNIDSAKPSDLAGSEPNALFFHELLSSVDSPDIIVFGFQEVIPLTDKKLTARTLLFGGKNKEIGATADKVSLAYRQWLDKLQNAVRLATSADSPYVKIHSESLVGLFTCIFVKSAQKHSLRDLDICTVKRGIGGIYGNKGAIVARMVFDDTSICFINVHLAAGQSAKTSRNQDLGAIMEDKAILPAALDEPFVHGGDGTAILDHEIVILNGDLNYRIDQRRENVLSSITAGEIPFLLEHDQLRKEMRNKHAFRLRSFEEAPITFSPTYKYNTGSEEYDSSEKRRIPAWCDRILYTKSPRIQSLNYLRYEATISDHRPVSAGFKVSIKSVNAEKRIAVRGEVGAEWAKREAEMLDGMVKAYERLF